MAQEKDGDADPFAVLHASADAEDGSPAARRKAFRWDPHGCMILGTASQCQITRNEGIVHKSGARIRAEEGLALKFAASLRLPVPDVHGVESSGQGVEIAMDFVDGECLEEAWPAMSLEEKQDIARQLRHIVAAMRKASPQPANQISAFGGPVRDCRQFSDYVGGPFDSEAEFNRDFILDLLKGTPSSIRQAFAKSLKTSSRIVFTHGDLTPRNILVKDNQIQAVLDWEYSGWYPEYWEYVKFFDRPTDCRDWKNYAEIIFETEYPNDLLTFQALARWQKP